MVFSASTPFGAAGGANYAGSLPAASAGTAAPFPGSEQLPLVDGAVLHAMEEQLGRSDLARNFAKDYSALWGQRERRIVDSLEREDQTAALDAAISLKVSSAMVGGLRLASLAQMLETAVRHGDLRHGASVLAMISIHGPATVNELQHQYLRKPQG